MITFRCWNWAERQSCQHIIYVTHQVFNLDNQVWKQWMGDMACGKHCTSDITRSVLHFKIIGYVGGVSASQTDEKIN